MKYLEFLIIQTAAILSLATFNILSDLYITKPFNYIEALVLGVFLALLVLVFKLAGKFSNRYSTMRLRTKLLLFVTALILAMLVLGAAEKLLLLLN
ncbi:hypothetical protein [Bacillus sp. EB01]|uniref:hypothetical protein n=1 Tax=Bacillus sp. EB01 TaxID=1347086 RepID=UPI0005C673B1|nr:hypothetical protein [Bacillus sp. EB01]